MNITDILLQTSPGTEIRVAPDWFVLTDGTASAVPSLLSGAAPADSGRVKVFIDHETPCGSEAHAAKQKALIRFAEDFGCELFNGRGVSYQLMLDRFVESGQLVVHCGDFGGIYASVGAFAVRVSPEALEVSMTTGELALTVPERVELELVGRSCAICGKDAALNALKQLGYIRGKTLVVGGDGLDALRGSERTAFFQMLSACGASFIAVGTTHSAQRVCVDLIDVESEVSDPENILLSIPVAKMTDVPVTAVFIGGCSTGRIEDIRTAASLLKGKKVCRSVRLTISFATSEVYIQAANEGLIDILLDGGAAVMNQGCSACYAHSQGLVDMKDTVLSAGSRACPDSLGGGSVNTYICSAATAMASAIAGYICPAGN